MMQVKIDTKEKFHVISIKDSSLAANMTAELRNLLLPFLEKDVKNIIVNLNGIPSIDPFFARELVLVQQMFYDSNVSLVVCCLSEQAAAVFEESDLLESLNYTPTESEAADIVQMEEIERELLDEE